MNVLITGVGRGLGQALCLSFLGEGHAVWGISRSDSFFVPQNLENYSYSRCDISNEEEVNTLFSSNIDRVKSLDLVVLNAGSMEDDIIDGQFSFDNFKKVFQINLEAQVRLVQLVLPYFHQKRGGMFIGISSLASKRAICKNKIAYASSKAALNMAFESFRIQLARSGIKFKIVNSGPLKADVEREFDGLGATSYQKMARKILSFKDKRSNILNYPWLIHLTYVLSIFFKDNFLSQLLSILPKESKRK
ncbi:MAG: SDR family oxidoreductase [Oligoflexia bacterium]|nr:SDR family oxidoreductase [Oligoflexia bacterium]